MRKGLYILFLILAASMFFVSCTERSKTSTISEPTETAEMPTFPEDLAFPVWIPKKVVQQAYIYALYSANQNGYSCGNAQNLIIEDNTEALSCFCEDGLGFCMYPVEAGMSQREFLVIGTSDRGENWHIAPETVHVTTYLGEPQVGEYVYISTGNDLQLNDTLIVLNRDGTDVRQIDVESLVPEQTRNKLTPGHYITVKRMDVDQNKNVSFELCVYDKATSEEGLHIHMLLDKDLQPTWEENR